MFRGGNEGRRVSGIIAIPVQHLFWPDRVYEYFDAVQPFCTGPIFCTTRMISTLCFGVLRSGVWPYTRGGGNSAEEYACTSLVVSFGIRSVGRF